MAKYRPEIKRAVMNRHGQIGYYPATGFRPTDAEGRDVWVETSMPCPTVTIALDQLARMLTDAFKPGADEIVIDDSVFASVEDAMKELRACYRDGT
jgi:hypothetical protein